ncbi:hypothetical protein NBRC116493_14270 [Aurantivibrio infirmus]
MFETPILNPSVQQQIKSLCYRGYGFYDQQKYNRALRAFYQAWLLLPKPQRKWREAGWVLTAIGDAYFKKRQYIQAREALLSALKCPFAKESPVVLLRLGQCYFELNDRPTASYFLQHAHKLGGDHLFAKEDQKYFNILEPEPEPEYF